MNGSAVNTRKQTIIIVIIVALALGSIVYLLMKRSDDAKQADNPQPTTSTEQKKVVYDGEQALYERGLLQSQIQAIEIGLGNFAKAQKRQVNKTTFSNVNHELDRDSAGDTVHIYSFTVQQDSATYTASATVITPESIRLYVYDARDTTKQLYDSRVIDMNAQSNSEHVYYE